VRRPKGDISDWMERYRRRASLDPLRAVLNEADDDNRKNAYLDAVERVHLRRLLARVEQGTAVDLGCGAGRLLGLLARRAGRVIGVDASPDLLAAAAGRGLAPSVRLVRGDLREVPLASGCADFLLTCQSLIHVVEDDDLELVAVEVRRLLRPGGRAVLMEHLAPSESTERREGIVFRTPEALLRPFVAAGLRAESSAPFRKSPSRLVHWVQRGRLPQLAWGIGARLEPWLAVRGREAPNYRDHLVVLRG